MNKRIILVIAILFLIILILFSYEYPLIKQLNTYEDTLGYKEDHNLFVSKNKYEELSNLYDKDIEQLNNSIATTESLIKSDIDLIIKVNEIDPAKLNLTQKDNYLMDILFLDTFGYAKSIINDDIIDIFNDYNIDYEKTDDIINDFNVENEAINKEIMDYLNSININIDFIIAINNYEVPNEVSTLENETCEPFYVEDILIANKNHCLDASFNPGGLDPVVQSAFNQMQADAKNEGINLFISSGFRSYEEQVSTFNYWVSLYGEEEAQRVSARPGYSEHQTGLVIDVGGDNSACLLEECFGDDPEGIWIANNAYKYGFIIRYKPGKEDITGYKYEPWHLRYVGVDVATEIYNQDTTLEEYLGVR